MRTPHVIEPAQPSLGERLTRVPGAALLIAGYLLTHPRSPYHRVRRGAIPERLKKMGIYTPRAWV